MRANLRALGLAGQVGLTMVLSILAGLFLGQWLDGSLGTKPVFTLILIFIGMIAGAWGVYRQLSWTLAEMPEPRPRNEGEA